MKRIFLLCAAAAVPLAASAHHGWSGYDSSSPLQVSGQIVESGYEHPHGHILLETPGKTWRVVLAPPSRMKRRGLPPEMLKPGLRASVEGYPHRSDAEEMRAERISVQGKTVELR